MKGREIANLFNKSGVIDFLMDGYDILHIFIPLKVSKIVEKETKNKGIDIKHALMNFYNSKVYDILEQEDTKLWYECENYLYMGWEMEQKVKNWMFRNLGNCEL